MKDVYSLNTLLCLFACAGRTLVLFLFVAVVGVFFGGGTFAVAEQMPEPNPPQVTAEEPALKQAVPKASPLAGQSEWTYHKSANNAHPDNNEQQLVWLMNKARSNPTAEGIRLAQDPTLQSAISYFSVNLDLMKQEFAAIAVKPPGAFDIRLYNGAYEHSLDLIARDAQDHNNQIQRMSDAGFKYSSAGVSVFSYAKSAIYCHGALNIDWGGDDGTGMQTGRGHRVSLMSINKDYSNVGFAMIPEDDDGTQVGPLVFSGSYAKAQTSATDHYNTFLVGTVWTDADADQMYDPGEGIGQVMVIPDSGSFYAVTSDSGGYAIPMPQDGTYQITFQGSSVQTEVASVTISGESVLLDYETSSVQSQTQTWNSTIAQGWSLSAMSVQPANGTVSVLLGNNTSLVNSVWKWSSGAWKVALPQASTQDLQSFLSTKGFSELESLEPGDGFWINADQAFTLSVSGESVENATLSAASGWTLAGLKKTSDTTVTELVQEIGGQTDSIWKWQNSTWAVALPQESDGGQAFASAKNFQSLTSISPFEGFWINKQ